MIARREALSLLITLLATRVFSACRNVPSPASPASGLLPARQLELPALVDLVPAAGLVWLVDARPRELLGSEALIPAVAVLVSEQRFDTFSSSHGGVDLRQATELIVAAHPDTMLSLVKTAVVPARIEAAFGARSQGIEGRAIEGPGIVRVWGTVDGRREQLAIFGGQAVGLEQGRFGPLRAALWFAEGKLHRSLPALRAEPLALAAKLAGDAPLRVFAPGPFRGRWASGVGGLLGAATAVAATLRPRDVPPNGAIDLTLVLTGAWGTDAPAAARELKAAFGTLAVDPLGRLAGVDRPLREPRVSGDPESLHLAVSLDPLLLARGLHQVTGATLAEILLN